MRIRTRLAIGAALLLGAGAAAYLVARPAAPSPVPAEPPKAEEAPAPSRAVIGYSVQGREIEAYTYGSGTTTLLFVGGIHGGYEWNSAALAYSVTDYLKARPEAIPANVSVVVVPNANPDAVAPLGFRRDYDPDGFLGSWEKVDATRSAELRFNANGVDLNRNFGCKWQPEASWRGSKVSAGTAAFSEPEARAIRDLALELRPAVAVFWHSQASAVYASECEAGILPETLAAMSAYAAASGYAPVESFDAYPVTGDAEGWLASVGIPAITVELSTHEKLEWERNLAGVEALLARYGTR